MAIGDLPLCRVLLMNNKHFPWLILVPRREHMRELFDLTPEDYAIATQEIRDVANAFANHTRAYKINIAALGNQVPQLHVHIIARFPEDIAWPKPVWNLAIPAEPYAPDTLTEKIQQIRRVLHLV